MDSAGTAIAGLISGTQSFFGATLDLITKAAHIGFVVSSMVHEHIVAMMSRLPSMVTGVLQLDELKQASEAVAAINPFGRAPYDLSAEGLSQAGGDLQNLVFEANRRLKSSRRRSSRRRAPTRKTKPRPRPVPKPKPVPTPKPPPKSSKKPKYTPKKSYSKMGALGATNSRYRNSKYGKKDGG